MRRGEGEQNPPRPPPPHPFLNMQGGWRMLGREGGGGCWGGGGGGGGEAGGGGGGGPAVPARDPPPYGNPIMMGVWDSMGGFRLRPSACPGSRQHFRRRPSARP